jgi:hypothetical protein
MQGPFTSVFTVAGTDGRQRCGTSLSKRLLGPMAGGSRSGMVGFGRGGRPRWSALDS